MFNQSVQKVLKELNSITNSAILKYPETVLVSDSQDIMVKVNMSELDSDEFQDVHLMDNLNEFLSLLQLFEEPEIELTDKDITLRSGRSESSFIFDNPILMEHLNKDVQQFTRTKEVPSVGSFEITVEDFKSINKASQVFKDLTEVIFKAQDGDVHVILGATNRFNAKSNTFSTVKPDCATKEFEIKIPVQNFKMLPVGNYVFDVKYNSARDAYRLFVKNSDIDLEILMSTKI